MKQIAKHISYLLLTCRKVEVPGLGSFLASYESASFDAYEGLFYPSRLKIVYSGSNDVKAPSLKDSLARQMQILPQHADELIRQFVEHIKTRLQRQHYCRLEGIGYLIDYNGDLILKDTFWKNKRFSSFSPKYL